MKVCSKCKRELPEDSFHIHKRDGLRSECKECESNRHKEHYKKNRDKLLAQVNAYRKEEKNQLKIKANKLKWYTNNKEKLTRYKRDKYHNDLQYKLASLLRRRINQALHKSKKSKSTLKLLGCSLDDFKKHIESLWQEGMSWDNYGEWHIDHKIPCATFDLTQEENQVKCFHYSNLRPLWRTDNLSRPKYGQDLSEVI